MTNDKYILVSLNFIERNFLTHRRVQGNNCGTFFLFHVSERAKARQFCFLILITTQGIIRTSRKEEENFPIPMGQIFFNVIKENFMDLEP